MKNYKLIILSLLGNLLILSCGEVSNNPNYPKAFEYIKQDDLNSFKKFVDENPDINLNIRSTIGGKAPIHKTAIYNSKNILKYMSELVNKGKIDPNIKSGTIYQKKAIHYASENGYLEIFKILREKPFNLKISDKNYFGNTSLHYIAENNRVELLNYISKLIKSKKIKFDKNLYINNSGETPLHYSVKNFNSKIFDLLIKSPFNFDINKKNKYNQDILHIASDEYNNSNESILKISELIKKGEFKFDPKNCKDIEGNTPLLYAAKNNNIERLNILIKNPFNLNLNVKNKANQTLLHLATDYYDSKEFILKISELIKKGQFEFDIGNSKDNKGNTPLHYIAKTGNEKIYNLLINKPFNLKENEKNKEGKTPKQIFKETKIENFN